MNNESVDSYLRRGCGRCDFYDTPRCKVHAWSTELAALRQLLLATELEETMKWGTPCYTLDGANVAQLAALRDRCVLSFFKGSLIESELLVRSGPNSHVARQLELTSLEQVHTQAAPITRLVEQAIALERSGAKVPARTETEPMPEELSEMLEANPEVAAAFADLTPGRQRSYRLHVGGAKQAKTRAARAERCIPKILAGRGFNER